MSVPNLTVRRSMGKRRSPLALVLCWAFAFSGCHGICDQFSYIECMDNAYASYRAQSQANKAWKHYSRQCADGDPHKCYYKDGFLDGFYDVAMGGQGCLPAIPPRRYWKSCYETAEGRLKICAYFQGYSAGVQAGFETGKARSNRLPTSFHSYPGPTCPTCPANTLPPLLDGLPEDGQLIPGILPIPPAPLNDQIGNGPILPYDPIPEDIVPFPTPLRVIPPSDQLFAPEAE